MKASTWLALSLAGNVALAGLVIGLHRGKTHSTMSPTPVRVVAGKAGESANTPTSTSSSNSPVVAGADTPAARHDLKELVRQMRAAGWPEDGLVMLLTTDYWQRRQKEGREFWHKARRGQVNAKQIRDWNDGWQGETKAAVDEVLGTGAYERYEKQVMLENFGLLVPGVEESVRDQFYALQKEWEKQDQDDSAEMLSGDVDSQESARTRAVKEAERERQMKALLGEERYAEYKLQQRAWGFGIGQGFSSLHLSDEQFVAAAQATMDFEERQAELSQLDQAGEIDPKDHELNQKELEAGYYERLKQILGPVGVLRYQQKNDWNFRETRDELRRQNLTDEQIDAAYRVRRANTEQTDEWNRLQSEGALKPEELQQRFAEAKSTLEADLKHALGDAGYLAYLKADDYRYRQLAQYAPAWKLTQDDVDAVWETLHDYQNQTEASAKQAEQSDSELQEQAQRALTQQVRQKLTAQLGEERYQRLKRAGIIELEEPE